MRRNPLSIPAGRRDSRAATTLYGTKVGRTRGYCEFRPIAGDMTAPVRVQSGEDRCGMAARLPQARHARQKEAGGDVLGCVERSAQHISLFVYAEELHGEPRDRVEHEVCPNDCAVRVWLTNSPVEQSENHELREGFVELGRV